MTKTAHVSDEKKKTVQEFVNLLDEYPVIGAVNMKNLPTKQLQGMRKKLREKNTVLKMTKKRLMKIAFDRTKKKETKKLQEHFKGMPALIFTKENPFKLYMELQKTKSSAPAKAGQEAPKDIMVSAGPTSFSPGPIIGQLGKFGIKTGVEAGKIVIKEDSVVAKKGDTITSELAGILSRLGIEPMEIGLNLTAVYEDKNIYEAELLHVDVDEYASKFASCYNDTFNLAIYMVYPTADTINVLLSKVFNETKNLAVSQAIISDDTISDIIGLADSHAGSLASVLPDDARPKGFVKKEEPPQKEEKKEEPQEAKEEPEDAAAGLGSLFG